MEKLDTRAVRKYWREVVKRAWKSATNEVGMKLIIIALILLLIITAFSGLAAAFGFVPIPSFVFQVSKVQAGLEDFCSSLALLVILFLAMLWRTPAEMVKEKEYEIKKLKDRWESSPIPNP